MTDNVSKYTTVKMYEKELRYWTLENGIKWLVCPAQCYVWIPSTRKEEIDRLESAISKVSWVTWESDYGIPHIVKDISHIFPKQMGGTWLGWDYMHDIGIKANMQIMTQSYIPESNMNDMNSVLNNFINGG